MIHTHVQVPLDCGIVLRSRPYRETSLLVDVLTEHHGRLRMLGKGVRRGKHPVSRILRTFNKVRISWAGYGELPLLTHAELVASDQQLAAKSLYCGFYLSELVLELLPREDPYPGLFALFDASLGALKFHADVETVLRAFELNLLDELGYGMRLDQDTRGFDIDPDGYYFYHPAHGAVPASTGERGVVSGATLLAMARRQFSGVKELAEAKRIMRNVLSHYLNGRPLKSRELFKPHQSGRDA